MECPVCHFAFDAQDHRPKEAPCGYTRCQSCLQRLPETRCPECQQCFGTTDVAELPDNRAVKAFIGQSFDNRSDSCKWCSVCATPATSECAVKEHSTLDLQKALRCRIGEAIRQASSATGKHLPSSHQKDKQFLARSYKSREDFTKEYDRLYCVKARSEELYYLVLSELEKAVAENNLKCLEKLGNYVDYIKDAEDRVILRDYFDNANSPVKIPNLVILACKHNKVKLLQYVLSGSKFPSTLSGGIRGTSLLPDDEDETHHNAFYYAIRSGNVELLDTLIRKWPGNYFATRLEDLEVILSRAYDELKLKNVPLSEKVELFVEEKLLDIRFFGDTSECKKNEDVNLNNIIERIDLVLQKISMFKTEFSNSEKVDERALLIAKFIAQNIHILKRLLKSSYKRLPWEEIEFCLISFISSHMKRQEINLTYYTTLTKSKILSHLEIFAIKLAEEKDIMEGVPTGKLALLPNLQRERVAAEIISSTPQFAELYMDHQQIRDIHTLEKIESYVRVASLANPDEKEGQLVITRNLQVIGEHLKNTLESPKLSSSTIKLLLLSLPRNTRAVVTDLRNSLSHAYSLMKRTQIEENADVKFFIGVQNDTKKIGDVISDILYKEKIRTVRILLKKMADSENFFEMKEVAEILSNVSHVSKRENHSNLVEHDELEKLLKELSVAITDKTKREENLFEEIHHIITMAKTKSANVRSNYTESLSSLKILCEGILLDSVSTDGNAIRRWKFFASKTLENIAPTMASIDLKNVVKKTEEIYRSAGLRMQADSCDKVNELVSKIFHIAAFGTDDLKWIQELREKFKEKDLSIPVIQKQRTFNVTEQNRSTQLTQKLSELRSMLESIIGRGKPDERLSLFKRNITLQVAVEMLVLDIMSILEKRLGNNRFLLDDNTPLLVGKSLRDHLAHYNTVVDVLPSDPTIAIILNAQKLVSSGKMLNSKQKIGKLVKDNLSKAEKKFNERLNIILTKKKMFAAVKEGNIEDVKSCLQNGADLNSRSIDSSTSLHLASRGPCLEIIKFILDQNVDINAKDINGQSPLHIAAAFGRKETVEYLIRECDVNVDCQDERFRTPLHIAAKNGHIDTVVILLKHNVSTNTKDSGGSSPLHLAVRNNYIDVAKILLEKECSVDSNETKGGYTSLHIAAESGHLQLVTFLLKNGANVNARNDRGVIPLHTTALNGHLECVKALVAEGADVNSRIIDGCTPLHYAVQNGHEEIATVLLTHGADPNVVDKTFNNTPLHSAAKDGHENIVKVLLMKKANARACTVADITPLHFAAQSGHSKIIATLLGYGVDIDAKDKRNATPLHHAAERGQKEVVELLIKNGAKVDSKAYGSQTPLHVACLSGHERVVEVLIQSRASVRAKDTNGCTPLHAAAVNGSSEVIGLLLKSQAEVDVRNTHEMTPLHLAALNGHSDAVHLLIESKAIVNTRASYGVTPLQAAITAGHKDVVNVLIKNKAEVNVRGTTVSTPLHDAVFAGHEEIVKILLANGANVNVKASNKTPLLSAIEQNNWPIVNALLGNGASANGEGGEPLFFAVLAGYKDIVEVLLKNEACVNVSGPMGSTPLHLAAGKGHKEIVKTLIEKGANVNACTVDSSTPLHVAAQGGHEEVVEILIASGANVNAVTDDGNPLHLAAAKGHVSVVEVLLSSGTSMDVRDKKNRTPLELAVAHGRLEVVKMLLQCKNVDVNAKGNDDWTALHIASQENSLEMVKYLVEEGANINARNCSGSKPIHIAAREGYVDTVKFFLSQGISIEELGGKANQTLLHYASMKSQMEVANYLIAHHASIDAKDGNGQTPLHIAVVHGTKDIVEFLLQNGATYNVVDKFNMTPLELTNAQSMIYKSAGVRNLLELTEKLFESVKCNSPSLVQKVIKSGACVDARNATSGTALHYAASKGYDEVVKILLRNKANPNAVISKGFTPLHYAVKFSHPKIAKALLSHGAVYDAVSNGGKTPSDFSSDRDITSLFKQICESFKKVKEGKGQVVNDLNKINDTDTLKAVMGARNRENKTLVVAAVHCKFSHVEQLKDIKQGDISSQVQTALTLSVHGNCRKALSILRAMLERRTEILGPDNPGTLDIQSHIAKVLYQQGSYQEALKMLREIFEKQKEMLGLQNEDTLSTRSTIALVLHRLGKDDKAFTIYEEVFQKQKELLGLNHSETLNTQFHMALVLHKLGKYEDALNINRSVYEKRKETLGTRDPNTVGVLNNIAMVLASQGKHEESLKIYEEVLEKKKTIFGINHVSTLRTLNSIGMLFFSQEKYDEALKTLQEVLNIQKKVLPLNHPETLNTQCSIGNVLVKQGKLINALKIYQEGYNERIAVLGPNHPTVLTTDMHIEAIRMALKSGGIKVSEVLEHLQNDVNIAASEGDLHTVQRLLNGGADVNDTDIDGRTPLHFAASNGHTHIVKILLKHGAIAMKVTSKGNTPLHSATSNSHKDIVEILLQHVSREKLSDFVNATTFTNGTTSLHVAAKVGSMEIVKCLLKHGAIYDIQNKEGKRPIDIATDEKIIKLLETIDELFLATKAGSVEAIRKLRALKTDELRTLTQARSNQGNTLLQVALTSGRKNVAGELVKMLKNL